MGVRATGSAVSAERGGKGGTTVGTTLAAVGRYWWIVLAVLWLAVLGALVATARTPTTYLGRTSLIVSSQNRAPEQDAVLVQGYVSYFDDPAYQQQLLAEAGVDAETLVSAQAAAASPILVITATTSDATKAQSAAIAVAEAFRRDINEVHARTTDAAIATMQDQLDTALARKDKVDQTVIAALQDRIRQLQTDQDNVLQELQSRGGVSVQPPSLFNNLALAAAGGTLIGVLSALALAKFSPRLRSPYDVADKVGLNTLVELPRMRSKGAPLRRDQQLRQLANTLRASLGGPAVVAVTQANDGASTWVVARGLAMEWAAQGYAAVLVRFGGGTESPPSRIGGTLHELVKPADASAALSRMRAGPAPGVSVLDMRMHLVGGATSLPAGKVAELLKLDALVGAFVIIETPAVVESAVAQAASLAADATILVIDTQVAKVTETREAVGVLRQSGVTPLGAVLAPMGGEEGGLDQGDSDDESGSQPASRVLNRASARHSTGWSW